MIGALVGPYEVTAFIGRGGMGEVYRARDERLGRDVALKLLPPEFAADKERLARFEREARLLASLEHQNIASIFGIEQHDGRPVLVMELAEGEDLSVRLGGGALPADEVEKLARQLAAGLEYAHEKGVVHRDLKPANLKIAPGGVLKILDFGLARAFEGPAGSVASARRRDDSATLSQGLTAANTVIGTAAYMSPEQTRGYEVDRRADIWAFGVVVWEMLTGRRLFAGETSSDVLAAVLRQDPDWDAMPPDASPVLVAVCRRCLERDPQLRLRDIGEARVALEGGGSSMMGMPAAAPRASAAAPAPAGRPSRLPWLTAAAAVVMAAGVLALGLAGRLGPRVPSAPLVRSTVVLGPGQGLYLNPGGPGAPVVSPDGRHLAFTVQDSTGQLLLAVRALDNADVRTIPGTTGATYLFWSPDSRSVGYFSGGGLHHVDIAGGPVVPVCPTENAKSGSWSVHDEILFTPNHAASIMKVSASGGEPVAVTDLAADADIRSHRFPHWLPDGEHFLYLAWFRVSGADNRRPETVLRVASVDGGVSRDLMPMQTNARYVAGHLVYIHEGNLMARPFSLDELAFTGPPRPVMGDVLALGAAHYGVFSASDTDVLAFVRGGGAYGDTRIAWADGGERPTVIPQVRSALGLAVAPDGRQLVVSVVDEQSGSFDLWVHDVARELATRLTFAPESEMQPVWSRDGRWIYYTADQQGLSVVERIAAGGGGRPEQVVVREDDVYCDDISPDGRLLAYTGVRGSNRFTLYVQDLAAGGEPRAVREGPFSSGRASFSPDGRWLAYTSDETGRQEVFVESLTPDGGRWRISSTGGNDPCWSPAGDRVYFQEPTGDILATEIVTTDDGVAVGRTATVAQSVLGTIGRTFAVDPASGRLLVQVPTQANLNNRIELVTGWQALLAGGED